MSSSDPQPDGRPRMRRRLGMRAVFAICTGAMFSSGFFLLPGLAADEVGPAVPLVYLLAGLAMLPATLCVAELSSAMPRAGGPYLFLLRAMGPAVATVGGIGQWVMLLFKAAFAFVGVGVYLSLVVDVPVTAVAVGLVVAFTALNLAGARQTAAVEIGLVSLLLALLVYFVVAGGSAAVAGGSSPADAFTPLLPSGVGGLVAGMALVAVSYAGISQVASVAEEVKEPARALPRGMLASLGVATVLYVAGTALMVALITPDGLRDDVTPAATAAEQLTALPLPVWVMVVAALAAFMSTGNAGILSAARFPLAMARDGFVWERFARLDGKGTPRTAVLATSAGIIGLIVLLDVERIAKLASAFLLLMFGALCAAVLVLRESGAQEYDPGFRVPAYPWLPLLGMVVTVGLMAVSGWEALLFVAAVVAASTGWYALYVRERASTGASAGVRLLARMGRRVLAPAAVSPDASAIATSTDELVARAIVAELRADEGLGDALARAAEPLAERVGAEADRLVERLAEALRDADRRGDAVVGSVLLEGIQEPEMALLRSVGGVEVPGTGTVHGVLLVVGDARRAPRVRRIVGRLGDAAESAPVARAWRQADDVRNLREALRRRPRTLTFTVEPGTLAAHLAGRPLREIDLPEHCLVTLVHRGDETLVPDGSTRLAEGDEVTLLAATDVLADAAERIGLEAPR